MIQRDADLSPFNTLRLPARARAMARPATLDQLSQLLAGRDPQAPLYCLGEGSNLVLTADLPGLTLIPAMSGMQSLDEDSRHVWVAAGAGVHWDDVVAWTVKQGWQGLENLSLIPGAVGAAPFQNIGAYGAELSQVVEQVTVVDVKTLEVSHLGADQCGFGYRDSRFKSADRGRFVITGLLLRLNKQTPCDVSYGALKAHFADWPADRITPAAVREQVIAVRRSKLPDPAQLANAGSFFKNPVVSEAHYRSLKEQYPQIVAFPVAEGHKLAAGWLIEQAGWKGQRLGPVGMHSKQALVLVNHGGARCDQVQNLANAVRNSVFQQFRVLLEQEPVALP